YAKPYRAFSRSARALTVTRTRRSPAQIFAKREASFFFCICLFLGKLPKSARIFCLTSAVRALKKSSRRKIKKQGD
ncbi:MAG: hypothetical protein LBL05_00695, partial [Synergistaceae bacterium]|nr:hypothetical protein [Synergistaceae bacterium]